jgi:hypothetical protein
MSETKNKEEKIRDKNEKGLVVASFDSFDSLAKCCL